MQINKANEGYGIYLHVMCDYFSEEEKQQLRRTCTCCRVLLIMSVQNIQSRIIRLGIFEIKKHNEISNTHGQIIIYNINVIKLVELFHYWTDFLNLYFTKFTLSYLLEYNKYYFLIYLPTLQPWKCTCNLHSASEITIQIKSILMIPLLPWCFFEDLEMII